MLNYICLNDFSDQEIEDLKEFIVDFISGLQDLTMREKVNEMIESNKHLRFYPDDRITFDFPYTILANDLLAGIGYNRRKKGKSPSSL